MKDAKTGILIQAEFRVTMEFININNKKKTQVGYVMQFLLCLLHFHMTSYSCHETGAARHMQNIWLFLRWRICKILRFKSF